jgi:hypothetical protein
MSPTPRHNAWYHWTVAARRGLTFLESRTEVDPQKLGVFGISVGGTLTWSIAALDSRVKAAAPIYGCGWEFYPYPPDEKAVVVDDLRLWRTLIAPETHAGAVRCPVLLLSATNDFHGRMDLAFRTLDRLPADTPRSQVFSRDCNHHVEPPEARSLPLFMDTWLKGTGEPWPASPEIEILTPKADGGESAPRVRVDPKSPADRVTRVDVYYSLNPDWPTGRFWRVADASQEKEGYFAAAPYLSPDDTLTAFANVTYASGVRLSTRLIQRAVAELSGAKPTLERQTLIDSMETSGDWHWSAAYTDPCRDDGYFTDRALPGGERAFTLNPKVFSHAAPMAFRFGTYKIGDPQFRGAGRLALMLDCLAESTPEKLTVRLSNRPAGQNPMEFTTTLPPPAGTGSWRTWRMQPSAFRDAAGTALPGWDHVEQFELEGVSPPNRPPVFKRLRWEE